MGSTCYTRYSHYPLLIVKLVRTNPIPLNTDTGNVSVCFLLKRVPCETMTMSGLTIA